MNGYQKLQKGKRNQGRTKRKEDKMAKKRLTAGQKRAIRAMHKARRKKKR